MHVDDNAFPYPALMMHDMGRNVKVIGMRSRRAQSDEGGRRIRELTEPMHESRSPTST